MEERGSCCTFVGTGVLCSNRNEDVCKRCGFNPEVKRRRLKKLQELRPELALASDGEGAAL